MHILKEAFFKGIIYFVCFALLKFVGLLTIEWFFIIFSSIVFFIIHAVYEWTKTPYEWGKKTK